MDDEKKQAEEISKIILKEFGPPQINSILKIHVGDVQTLSDLKAYLTMQLSELLDSNFNKLINILYRVDVNEEKLQEIFMADNRQDIPSTLADLIIERQLQKLVYRHAHNKGEF